MIWFQSILTVLFAGALIWAMLWRWELQLAAQSAGLQ